MCSQVNRVAFNVYITGLVCIIEIKPVVHFICAESITDLQSLDEQPQA